MGKDKESKDVRKSRNPEAKNSTEDSMASYHGARSPVKEPYFLTLFTQKVLAQEEHQKGRGQSHRNRNGYGCGCGFACAHVCV